MCAGRLWGCGANTDCLLPKERKHRFVSTPVLLTDAEEHGSIEVRGLERVEAPVAQGLNILMWL